MVSCIRVNSVVSPLFPPAFPSQILTPNSYSKLAMSTVTRTLLFLFTSLLLLVSILSFAPIPHFSSIGGLLAESTGWPFFKHVVDQVNPANHHDHQQAELRWPRGARPHHPINWNDVSIRSYPPRRMDEKDVAVLTASNFTDFVARNPYVVLNFYAPWCYWSNRLEREYAAAATLLKAEAVFAKIDATVETVLERKYRIQYYPTIILFVGGVQNSVYSTDFDRNRHAITSWVRQKVELDHMNHEEVAIDVRNNYGDSSLSDKQMQVNSFRNQEKDVVILTNQNFNDVISRNQYVMVNFYASWSSWSKKLAPVYAAAATMLKGEVVLAKVECYDETELRQKYKIEGFPTIILFVGGVQNAVDNTDFDWNRDSISSWMRQKMAADLMNDQEVRGSVLPDNYEDSSWSGKQMLVNSLKNDLEKSLNKAMEDVVVLTNQNFSDFISRNHFVMVNFYASWCYWSKQLAPEYAATATMLKGEVVLAKVEASVEKELAEQYHIQGYPTMRFFISAKEGPYYGDRSRDAIANWVRQQMGGVVQNLTSTEDFRPKSTMVLGILESLEGPESGELAAAAKLHPDILFYQTDNIDVGRFFHIDQHVKHPALVMLKEETGDHTHIYFDGVFTRSAIADFVLSHKQASMITYAEGGSSYIFENPMKKLFLFAPKDSRGVISIFQELEKTFRGKLLFVLVPDDVGVILAHQFDVCVDDPKVVAYNGKGNTKKFIYEGELTFSSIKLFIEKFLRISSNLSGWS